MEIARSNPRGTTTEQRDQCHLVVKCVRDGTLKAPLNYTIVHHWSIRDQIFLLGNRSFGIRTKACVCASVHVRVTHSPAQLSSKEQRSAPGVSASDREGQRRTPSLRNSTRGLARPRISNVTFSGCFHKSLSRPVSPPGKRLPDGVAAPAGTDQ